MKERERPQPAYRDAVDVRRRNMLAMGATGAGVAVAASLASDGAAARVAEPPEEQIKGRYRLTPHIERFYFLNRL